VETHSATISDVGPDRGFHDLPQRPSPEFEASKEGALSAVVVRDTVNIFDLIAI